MSVDEDRAGLTQAVGSVESPPGSQIPGHPEKTGCRGVGRGDLGNNWIVMFPLLSIEVEVVCKS